jgi:Putative transposase DNA-binding domain
MKRGDCTKQIRVYKFGLVLIGEGVPAEAISELWRANRLWNALVEYDRSATVEYRAIVDAADTLFGQLNEAMRETQAALDTAFDEKRKLRQRERKRTLQGPEITAIEENNVVLKTRVSALRVQISARKADAKEKSKPALDAFYARDKAAISERVKQSGLVWSNHELVTNAFEVARQRARKEGAEIRFHSFDGTGRWGWRVSGGISVDEFFGLDGVIQVARPPDDCYDEYGRGHARRCRMPFRMRLCDNVTEDGSREKVFGTFHIHLHRPFPPDALIKALVVKRERIGDRFRYFACFTLAQEVETIFHPKQRACAIDFGWRETADGGLRVATIVSDDGETQHLALPKSWMDGMDHVTTLAAQMQSAANDVVANLKALLANWPIPEGELMGVARSLKRLRDFTPGTDENETISSMLLHRLFVILDVRRELAHELGVPDDFLAALSDWYKPHLRLYREHHNLGAKLRGRRKDLYRNFALKLCQAHHRLVIEEIDLRQLARVKDQDEVWGQQIRRNRQRAAVYELKSALSNVAKRLGCDETNQDAAHTTLECSSCGAYNRVGEMLHFACSECGALHDQDVNAGKNLLRRAGVVAIPAGFVERQPPKQAANQSLA